MKKLKTPIKLPLWLLVLVCVVQIGLGFALACAYGKHKLNVNYTNARHTAYMRFLHDEHPTLVSAWEEGFRFCLDLSNKNRDDIRERIKRSDKQLEEEMREFRESMRRAKARAERERRWGP